jgi:predicted metal-binding membrane protein
LDSEGAEREQVGQEPDEIAARLARDLRGAGVSCETVDLVTTDAAVLWRDRIVVILALILLTALAWSYLLWLSADMDMAGMDVSGFRTVPTGTGVMRPAHTPWRAMEFAFVFAMWTTMMVGMMTPSAAPMILMYARAGRQTKAQGAPLAATVWFVVGYFLPWIAFSLLATLVQWALERTALLDSTMSSTSNVLGGLVFLAVGTYEWTRLKHVCLAQCQAPFAFLMRHGGFRPKGPSALMLGFRYGVYCTGCCWTLMALLLVGGIMNVLWIILLSLLILSEKVTSSGRLIARIVGAVFIVAGAWFLAKGIA